MQQHPTLFLNKIKIKSCSSLCSCGCCTCVCQPHPCSDLSPSAQWFQTRRTELAFQRNLNEPRSEFKPGGLNQAGQPTFFIKFAKATSLEQSTPSLHVCKRATKIGHGCRLAGLGPHLSTSLREPSRGTCSIPLLPYPSCFRSKFTLIKLK